MLGQATKKRQNKPRTNMPYKKWSHGSWQHRKAYRSKYRAARRKRRSYKKNGKCTKSFVRNLVQRATSGLTFMVNQNYNTPLSTTFTDLHPQDYTNGVTSITGHEGKTAANEFLLGRFSSKITLKAITANNSVFRYRIIWFLWYQDTVPLPDDLLMGLGVTQWVNAPYRSQKYYKPGATETLNSMGSRYWILKDVRGTLPVQSNSNRAGSSPWREERIFIKNLNRKIWTSQSPPSTQKYPSLQRFVISDNIVTSGIDITEWWQLEAKGRSGWV